MSKSRTVTPEPQDLSIRELLKLDQGAESITIDRFQYLRHIYRQMPIGIALTVLCAALAGWVVQTQVPQFLVVPWLLFMATTSGLHLIVVSEFNKNKTHIGTSSNWSIYNTFLCSVTALAWGVGSMLFLPYLGSNLQLIFLGILAFYTVACMPILAALFSGYILFLSIIAFSLLLCMIFQPFPDKMIMLLALAGSYVVLAVISAYFNRSLMGAFNLAVKFKDGIQYLYDLNEMTRNDNAQLKKKFNEEQYLQHRLISEKEHAEITLQSIGEGVITTDTEGYVIYINPVAELLTGWQAEAASGECITELFDIIEESSREKLDDPVQLCLSSNSPVYSSENTTVLIQRDQTEHCIEYSATPIRNKKDIVTGAVLVFRDVTDKRNITRDLIWQASHDTLTGLINRREFENRLLKILNSTETTDRQHALCYIDLDQFKIVNDSCGHLAGDALLQKIARKLRGKTRETDTLGRLGGDEFGVILYSCGLDKARLIADSFRKEVEEIDFIWEDKHFKAGISIGIVPITKDTHDISELLQLADMACYSAKDAGRNQIHIYTEEDHKISQRRGEMHWVDAIQDALEREKFVLYAQEIRAVGETNSTAVCELLLRMKQGDDVDISAARFMKTAERYHLMPKLDRWVIKAGFEMLSYGHPLLNQAEIIGINLSGQSIADTRTVEYIIDLAGEYEIDSNKICFEIEETTLINNPQGVKIFIEALHKNGFHFALDNFSSGMNILSQINNLNLDYVKVNGRLSDDYSRRVIDRAAIEAVNKLCHLMGTRTVAKFVTDTDHVQSLRELGTDYIQGYAIASPKPLAKATQ